MTDFKNRVRSDWAQTLAGILEQARLLGRQAVLAFDLDSTVFDNLPRQARIVREFGAAQGVASLLACRPEHWTSGWDMKAAMVNCGLTAAEADALYPEAKAFWQERFFTSDYCVDDTAIQGASAYLRSLVATSATLTYVTGRHEGMRAGTVQAMTRCELPTPGGNVQLIMKPTPELDDDAFKRDAHRQLGKLGRLIAAFDNEPTHANDYRRQFPEATIIHLATDHSGRPVELLEGVVSVPHFGS